MNKKVKNLLESWKEKCMNCSYDETKAAEIALNCLSLSKTWFDNHKTNEKVSYEVKLTNSDGNLVESLQGITEENLPLLMMETITTKKDAVSLLALSSFTFKDGKKTDLGDLGKLEIS